MDFLKEAERIVEGQMQLVDYEGEEVTSVNADTELYYYRHTVKGRFWGWNIYAQCDNGLILLETCESKRLARNLMNSIRRGLAFGATWFRLPGN